MTKGTIWITMCKIKKMKREYYTLVPVTGGYAFRPEKGENTKTFTSKEGGMEVLVELMGESYEDSIVTPKNVVELITQMKGDAKLKCFKNTEKNKNEEAKGKLIQVMERFIATTENWAKKTEAKETGVPAFVVCPNCGKHGSIYTKNKVADDVSSKTEAKTLVDELMQLGEFDETGKTKLLEEINASNLPEEEPANGGGTNLLSGLLIEVGPGGMSVAEISVIGFRG